MQQSVRMQLSQQLLLLLLQRLRQLQDMQQPKKGKADRNNSVLSSQQLGD